ncbi:MAG: integrase core domain-containing protein [Deltaproteobacteria bacterium]
MEERFRFVKEFGGEVEPSLASVCRRYGVSRKTGYKWLERYRSGGLEALADRPPIAGVPAGRLALELEDLIAELRKQHSDWGPKKLRQLLVGRWEGKLPAESTIGLVLKRRGLIRPRRRRVSVRRGEGGPLVCEAPNDLWCTDFKGHFKLGNGAHCHPFTLTDGCTRYLLRCRGLLDEKGEGVRGELTQAFLEFGMPWRLRSDNGPPFGARAPGGLSRNAIWLIQLGITPEFIVPGHPEQNGRHERFHRTLKDATASPPKETMAEQQQAFDHFGYEYNEVRPHEALGQVPPRQRYEPSRRVYTGRLSAPEYSEGEVRSVASNGAVSFMGKAFSVGVLLARQPVAFRQIEDGVHEVRYGAHCLGYFLERDKKPGLRPKRPEAAPTVLAADQGGSVCATEPLGVQSTPSATGEEVLGA